MDTPSRRTWRPLLLILMALLLVACGRRATPAPPPPSATAPAAVTATPAPSPTAVTPSPEAPPSPSEVGPRATATPLAQPAVVGAYVTAYLPGWGARPSGLAVLDGRVYVANQHGRNVSIIAKDVVERVVPVGALPGATVADPASGRVFVLNHLDSTVAVIEGSLVVATWELPETSHTLAVTGRQLWVGAVQGGRIHLLDTGTGARLGTTALDTESGIMAMAPSPDGATMVVASYNRTTAVDVVTLAEVARAELNSYSTVAVSADGRRIFVNHWDAEERTCYLVALDAATLREQARLPLPPEPSAALADPRSDRVYLLSAHANALLAIDGAAMEVVATIPVGLDPRHLALDPASDRLYVANQQGDSVTVIDTQRLARVNTVPLAARIAGMAVDPEAGTLYVATSSSDRVLAFGADGLRSAWYVGGHPLAVAPLPDRDEVAVLLQAEARLVLLGPSGEEVADYPTGRLPSGLTVDAGEGRIYAGDLMVDRDSGLTETLGVKTIVGPGLEQPPQRVAIDTRRGRAYAVAYNGVPGTNGGAVIAHLRGDDGGPGTTIDGRVGVGDLIYDADADAVYATVVRMSAYGLQVSDAATLEERSYLPLESPPSAAALNPGTHHLWLALLPPPDIPDAGESRLLAIDTRNLGTAAEIAVEGRLRSLAVDPRRNLVYAAVDGTGDIVIVQDVALPAPPRPATVQTPTPAATATPPPTAAPTPKATATRAPTAVASPTPTPVPVLSPTPTREEPCRLEVDPRLSDAYRRVGAEALGCPRDAAVAGQWAWQLYERGEMVWHGSQGVIYVLMDDGGYRGYTDEWREGMPALSCEADPPAGRQQPVRGFGRIWCLVGEAREGVGWAVAPEGAASGVSQAFDGGLLMLWDGNARWLRGDGSWIVP